MGKKKVYCCCKPCGPSYSNCGFNPLFGLGGFGGCGFGGFGSSCSSNQGLLLLIILLCCCNK
ncbi:hypothetical protein CLOACE_21110 [Clostridium acetireducens DSM 10703]|jgi:hypothetical protein|uniref:Uncharacterized protein n=1 Tax=Clostridium acetireducens DSM 10703 TaxID=1121290 RepID=A0A1E8EWG9_9CLOT|nr:hypothetical protein [Clostridium acetireducens]OFI01496.1 hypothetical protein CLOACE_21110 [Clostridium acetireducens DSM 10703]